MTSNYDAKGFNQLAGASINETRPDDASIQLNTYFVKAVPMIFDNVFGSTEIFQYSSSAYTMAGSETSVTFL